MDKWGQTAFNTLKQSDIDLCDRSCRFVSLRCLQPMSGLSSGIEALDFTDGQFAFEFNRYASGIGRNPGVHIFAGSCSAIAGEYESDVMTLVLLFVVLDGLNAGILDCE